MDFWRTMAKKKWTPEEREAFRRQKLEWEQERKDFAAMYERLQERWRLADERGERRRVLIRRLTRLGRSA
jgi:hypothetical protein